MGVFDDERAHRQAQHDYERAREERDREFFEAQQRRDRIWQEKLEQARREDAAEAKADAKADALARQQLWELFVKAVSKPTSVKMSEIVVPLAPVVPLDPDRELDQVDVHIRIVQTVQDVVHVRNDALNVVHVRNDAQNDVRETSLTSETTPENVVQVRNVENDVRNVKNDTSEASLASENDVVRIRRSHPSFTSESESSDPGTPRE